MIDSIFSYPLSIHLTENIKNNILFIHHLLVQSFNFSNAIIQFIVHVFGTISYFPFTIVTPYFGRLILNLFGK